MHPSTTRRSVSCPARRGLLAVVAAAAAALALAAPATAGLNPEPPANMRCAAPAVAYGKVNELRSNIWTTCTEARTQAKAWSKARGYRHEVTKVRGYTCRVRGTVAPVRVICRKYRRTGGYAQIGRIEMRFTR